MGSVASVHTQHSVVHASVALDPQIERPSFLFKPAITGVSQSEGLAAGGNLLDVYASGLNGTLVRSSRNISGQSCTATQDNQSQTGATSVDYRGLAFNVFAKRSMSVTGFDFHTITSGMQKVFVLARKKEFCAGMMTCSYGSFEANMDAWQVLGPSDGFDVSISKHTISFDPFPISAGKTHGFMLMSEGGVIYGQGQASGCSSWQDEFVSISAGPLVFGSATAPQGSLDTLVTIDGIPNVPSFLWGGTVHYDNDDIIGDVYRCHFKDGSNEAFSLPSRAFLPFSATIFTASLVQCLTPQWTSYPAAVTSLTLQSADGTEIDFGSHGNDVSTAPQFEMKDSWSSLHPTFGNALGGTIISLSGHSFMAGSDAAYMCRFKGLSGSTELWTPVTVVDSERAYCVSPYVNGASRMAEMDVLHHGTPISWSPSFIDQSFPVEGITNVCWNPDCCSWSDGVCQLTSNLYSSSCWNTTCSYHMWDESTGYSGRRFDIVDYLSGSVQPTIGPASGGTTLVVPGYGFDENATYFCAFENGVEGIFSVASVTLPPSILSCVTPTGLSSWGRNFAANDMGRNVRPQKFRVYKKIVQHTSLETLSEQVSVPLNISVSGPVPARPVKFIKIQDEYMTIDSIIQAGSGFVLSIAHRGAFATHISSHPTGSTVDYFSELLGTDPQAEATNFSFVTEWDIEKTSALLSNDFFNITFEGFGFDKQKKYYFVILSNTASVTSHLGYPLSQNRLVLTSPAWTGGETVTTVSLYEGEPSGGVVVCESGNPDTCTGSVTLTGFSTSWRSISKKKILAGGGDSLIVYGGIFNPALQYSCVFTAARTQFMTDAIALNSHRISCLSPGLDTAAETVTLTLLENGQTIPFVGAPDNQFLTYVQGLVSVSIAFNGSSANAPNIASSSGGVEFVIRGYGFETPSQNYVCQISANGNVMSSTATCLTSKTLRCLLPAWGAQYAASSVQLQVYQTVFGTDEKRMIDFMLDGSSSYPCIPSGPCMINLVPVLTKLVAPSTGSSGGGTLFRLQGAGFAVNQAYSCVFVSGTRRETSVATVLNPSEIQCVAPLWRYGASSISLHIFDSYGSEIYILGPEFVFTFESTWNNKDVSEGPSKGGSIVTVNGEGFQDVSVDYKCLFSFDSTTVTSHAESISRNIIVCVVPEWPFQAAVSTFSVYAADELVIFEGSGASSGRFVFREGWDGSIGPSVFSTRNTVFGANSYMPTVISIQGFGLIKDSMEYSCIFAIGLQTETTAALVVSHKKIECPIPAIGLTQVIGGGVDSETNAPIISVNPSLEIKRGSGVVSFYDFTDSVSTSLETFILVSTWHSAQVTGTNHEIQSSGGKSIFVSGAGFDSSRYYYCVLTNSDGDLMFSHPAQPSNVSSLQCTTGHWDYGVSYVSMTLIVSVTNVALPVAAIPDCKSASAAEWTDVLGFDCGYYRYYNVWCDDVAGGGEAMAYCCECGGGEIFDTAYTPPTSEVHFDGAPGLQFYMAAEQQGQIIPSKGPSRGGSTITVQGFGFGSNTSVPYSCFFNGSFAQTVPAKILSNTKIECAAPAVPVPELSNFAVLDSFGNLVKAVNASGQYFEYQPGWVTIMPTKGPSTGGTNISFSAYGLDESLTYMCQFLVTSEKWFGNMTSAVHVYNSSVATCTTPAWGLRFPVSTVEVFLLDKTWPPTSPSPVYTGLKDTNNVMLHSLFEFGIIWTDVAFSGPTEGGTQITLTGSGFPQSVNSSCVFELPGIGSVESKIEIESTSSATCSVPAWPFGQLGTTPGIVSLSLDFNTVTVGGPTFEYYVKQYWTEISPSAGLAKGGSAIRINGAGFDISRNYTCKFERDQLGISAQSIAIIIDSTRLDCTVPAWNYAAMTSNFSLHSSNSTSYIPTSPVEYWGQDVTEAEFQFIEGWDGIQVGSITVLASASESSIVALTTYGTNVNQTYSCSFSRGATESMSTTAGVVSNTLVHCPVPNWGEKYSAGTLMGRVAIDLVKGQSLIFTGGGMSAQSVNQVCRTLPSPYSCSVSFFEIWSPASLSVMEVAAAGQVEILVPAFGFDSGQSYQCVLFGDGYQTMPGDIDVKNSTWVTCTLPEWKHGKSSSATMRISTLNGNIVSTRETAVGYLQVADGLFDLHPSTGSAVGSSLGRTNMITVRGFGFNTTKPYVCFFANVTSDAVVNSATEILCPVPTWPLMAQQVRFSLEGTERVRLASRTPAAVFFQEIYNSNLPFDFYHEWVAHLPTFMDRLGGTNGGKSPAVTVTGFGFYPTGNYKCVFDVPGITNVTLYSASTTISSEQYGKFEYQQLVCIPPVWDAASSWGEFENLEVRMRLVFEHQLNGSAEVVIPLNGTRSLGIAPLHVVDINKIPAFEALDQVWVYRSTDSQLDLPYFFEMTAWAYRFRKGVLENGNVSATENTQNVSFLISDFDGDWADLYSVGPNVLENGTLQFTVNPHRFGNTNLKITMIDNGGLLFNGRNSVTKVIQINVQPKVTPSLFSSGTLTVEENSGLIVLTHFISDALKGRIGDVLNLMSFYVDAQAVFFTEMPKIDDVGSLSFQTAQYVWGNTTINIHVVEKTIAGSVVARLDYNITLMITPLNSVPSFSIVAGMQHIVVSEGEYLDVAFRSRFAYEIRPGPEVGLGPKGELWDEREQTVSFIVVGTSPLFSAQPEISTVTGNISFALVPRVYGNATFHVYLEDDAAFGNFSLNGVMLSGPQTTKLYSFSIHILPINDIPTFQLNCRPTLVNRHQFVCRGECSNLSFIPDWEVVPRARFEAYDLDNTGQWSLQEFKSFTNVYGGRKNFSTVDSDENGLVTLTELNVYANPVLESGSDTGIDPDTGKFNLIPEFFPSCQVYIAVDENCINCVSDHSLAGCPPERSFVVDDVIPLDTLMTSVFGLDYETGQKLTFLMNLIEGFDTLFDQQPNIDAETGRLTFCLGEDRNGSAVYSITLHDDGGTERGGINQFGAVEVAIRIYSVNQQPSFSFCSGRSCKIEDGECCSKNFPPWESSQPLLELPAFENSMPVWQSVQVNVVPNFLVQILNGQEINGTDMEVEQTRTFSVYSNFSFFDIHPRIEPNGTLTFKMTSHQRASFGDTTVLLIVMQDDGADLDNSSGTQAHNFAENTKYAGVDLFQRNIKMLVANSYLRLVLNVSGGSGSGVFAGLHRDVAQMLGIDASLVLINASNVELQLQILGLSFNKTLEYQKRTGDIAVIVQANVHDVPVGVRSSETFVKSFDHIPTFQIVDHSALQQTLDTSVKLFDMVNVWNDGVSMSQPSVISRVLGVRGFFQWKDTGASFYHEKEINVTVRGFLQDIISPPDSLLGLDGRETVVFDVVPIVHETRSGSKDLNDASVVLTLPSPIITSHCEPQCENGATATINFSQNPREYGSTTYSVHLHGTDVTRNFTILIEMLLRLELPESFGPDTFFIMEDRVNTSFPQLIRVAGVPGPLILNQSTFEVATLAGAEMFDVQPHIILDSVGGGELVFTLRRHAHGNATLFITADNDHIDGDGWIRKQSNLSLYIHPVNDAPYFEVNCSARFVNEMAVYNCSKLCSAGTETASDEVEEECKAIVEVEQNCRSCGNAGASMQCQYPFVLENFASRIAPITPNRNHAHLWDEAEQSLTFVVTQISSTARQSWGSSFTERTVFEHGFEPAINTSTGDLSFCLIHNIMGEVEFNITLLDDGGTLNGGDDVFGPVSLRVHVLPFNQQPSFELQLPFLLTALEDCDHQVSECDDQLVVWEHSGLHVIEGFAADILRGKRDDNGLDTELHQQLTFAVTVIQSRMFGQNLVEYDCPEFLQYNRFMPNISAISSGGQDAYIEARDPFNLSTCDSYVNASEMFVPGGEIQMLPNGTLIFELNARVHGEAIVEVVLSDDGGTKLSGVNHSITHTFTLTSVNSYLNIAFELFTHEGSSSWVVTELAQNISAQLRLRQFVADTYGISLTTVLVQSVVPRNISANSAQSRRLLSNNAANVSAQQLLAMQVTLQILHSSLSTASANGGLVQTYLLPRIRMEYNLQSIALISNFTFISNFDNEPSFRVRNGTVTVLGIHYPVDQPFELQGILQDIISPPDAVLLGDGREETRFVVHPLRYRQQESHSWSADTDGGIFASGPVITSECKPKCTIAHLHLAKLAGQYGEVEFEITMRQSTVKHKLMIKLMYAAKTVVEVLENQEESVFPKFIRSIFFPSTAIPPVYTYPLRWDNQAGVVGPTAQIGADLVPYLVIHPALDIRLVNGNASMFSGTPILSFGEAGYGLLEFVLSPHMNGNVTFEITPRWNLSTSTFTVVNFGNEHTMHYNNSIHPSFFGHGGVSRFTVVVRPVNQRPTFSIMPKLSVLRDEFVTSAANIKSFAFDILRGPANEHNQAITFSVSHSLNFSYLVSVGNATVERQVFSKSPYLDADGSLSFKISQYMYTETPAQFTAVLVDSAGTQYGGQDKSTSMNFSIEVLYVNYPPSFELLSDRIYYNESSHHIEIVATNISKGAEFSPEQQQVLSFVVVPVTTSPFFSIQHLEMFVNGSLLLLVEESSWGEAVFNITLIDNGGTLRNGSNTSETKVLRVQILEVNHVPSFVLLDPTVKVKEDQGQKAHVLLDAFVSNISAGHREGYQNLTFVIEAIACRVPDGSTQCDVSNLFGCGSDEDQELFAPDSSISISPSGNLSFTLNAYMHGWTKFSVTLKDGGKAATDQLPMLLPAVSVPAYFEIFVLPVDSTPSFNLSQNLTILEDSRVSYPNFATNIKPGGWNEQNQLFTFRFELVHGPTGVGEVVLLTCYQPDAGFCRNGSAMLTFSPGADRFGDIVYNVILIDSGGASTKKTLAISVVPVNDQPSFRLAADSMIAIAGTGCKTGDVAHNEWEFPNEAVCRPEDDGVQERVGFVRGISLGPFENGPHMCPEFTTCQSQSATFVVIPWDQSETARVFMQLPMISFPDGKLHFRIRPEVYVDEPLQFNVSLLDDGGLVANTSSVKTFSLDIKNRAPVFRLPEKIWIDEDRGWYMETVAVDIVIDGIPDHTQDAEFLVIVNQPSLFAVQPRMYLNGTLVFQTAPYQFGVAVATLTLKDKKAFEWGGIDSRMQQMKIVVRPINNRPTFMASVTMVELSEGDTGFKLPLFVNDIRAGPPNEDCVEAPKRESRDRTLWPQSEGLCQHQQVTFHIISFSNPQLFVRTPIVTSDGTLMLQPAPHASGHSVARLVLVDDGTHHGYGDGENTSTLHDFIINVTAINDRPEFRLPWRIKCDSLGANCSCPPFDLEGSSCSRVSLNAVSEVSVFENVGLQSIQSFATQITTQSGFLPGSKTVFQAANHDAGRAHVKEMGSDPALRASNMQYAHDHMMSPPGYNPFVYFAEFETDSVSVFALSGENHSDVEYVQRMTDGDRRLQFFGFGNNSFVPAEDQKVFGPPLVCSWDTFESNGTVFALASRGCGWLRGLENVKEMVTVCQNPAGGTCSPTMSEHTVGFWDFTEKSAHGMQTVHGDAFLSKIGCDDSHCTYSRKKRNSTVCNEEFNLEVGPATFRDSTGILGSAVLTGQLCNSNNDWMTPADETLSVRNFIMNDGNLEAVQFDGYLNRGLYVAENIDALVDGIESSSKLPLKEMTLEVWFTIDIYDINFAGLLAVQQDGQFCKRGWSLTYSKVTGGGVGDFSFSFSIALEGTFESSVGGFTILDFTFPGIIRGDWNYISVAYDGSFIVLYFAGADGAMHKVEKKACTQPPCGQIVYPAAYNISDADSCVPGQTPLTFGSYDNKQQTQTSPHVGAIKNVKISKRALSQEEIQSSHDSISQLMKASPVSMEEYWVNGDLVYDNPDISASPTVESADAERATNIFVKGRFLLSATYICVFEDKRDYILQTDASVASCTGQECVPGFGFTLSCSTPLWEIGYSLPVFRIKRKVNGIEIPVWQRLCIHSGCGFIPYSDRTPTTSSHGTGLYKATTYGVPTISSTLVGTQVKFRFTMTSYIFEFDPVHEIFLPGVPLGEDWLGASSATPFTVASGNNFVLVANFWDGDRRDVQSVLLQFNDATKQFTLEQTIPTFGARRWHHFEFEGAHYFIVANQIGESTIYGWDISNNQLNLTAPVQIAMTNATSVAVFESQGSTFVAISSDDENGASPAKVFRLEPDAEYGVHAILFQTLRGYEKSLDVTFAQLSGFAHLVFALNTNNPSPVLALASSGTQFDMVQALPVSHVTSMLYFLSSSTTSAGLPYDTSYLMVKQKDSSTVMFRWNGTTFLGASTSTTQPTDASGGQVLRISEGSGAVAHFRALSRAGSAVDYLLVGNKQDSLLYHGQHDRLDALRGPSSIAVTENYVFVGCQTSKAIVVFRRDAVSGRIMWQLDATYRTNYTKALLLDNVSTSDLDSDAWNLGFPLQGISAMVVGPSGDKLFTTGFVDNVVASFSINSADGSLTLLSWIQDGSMDKGGRRVDGLAGAFGISVTTTNDIYVAGATDQAVTVLQSQGNGDFVFIDRLKNGERLISSFPGILAKDLTDNLDLDNGPMRLRDGAADQIWEHSARDSQHFSIEGEMYVIVASSDEAECTSVDTSCVASNGIATLYRWDLTTSSFVLHQSLDSEVEASAVAAFHKKDENGTLQSYVVVCNMFGKRRMDPVPSGTINVYQWDNSVKRLIKHHTISSPESSSTECPREIGHTEVKGISYLAVANVWNDGACKGPSYVYRWNSQPVSGVSQNVPTAWDPKEIGFEFLQTIHTKSATDIRFGNLGNLTVLVVADENMIQRDIYTNGGIDVYKFQVEAQTFTKLQTLTTGRVFGIELFTLPVVGNMLAVATRQTRKPSSGNDYEAYDGPSALYVWDSEVLLFKTHQVLTSFSTTAEDESSKAKREAFCNTKCDTSSDGSQNLPLLRGATSFTAFESDGEYYLAVAQSVCEPFVSRLDCVDKWGQPKSAILQFNKETNMFGEMLAITDADNRMLRGTDVPVSEMKMHSQALRINAGRALKIEYVETSNGVKLLIVCSSTQGAIVYPWKFEKVQGLAGVVSVIENPRLKYNMDPSGTKVYAISRLDSSFVELSRKTVRDSLGFEPRTVCYDDTTDCTSLCSTSLCLQFRYTLATKDFLGKPLAALGYANKLIVAQNSGGLHQMYAEESCRDKDCSFIAIGGLNRDELLCGDFSAVAKDTFTRAHSAKAFPSLSP